MERRDYVPQRSFETDEADIDILAANPTHLQSNCVVPHALDDQWVPRALIRRLLTERKSISELNPIRLPLMRREYIRCLLTSRQIVVNRSYLYRNPIISADYVADKQGRQAFARLLKERAIVPFLLKERSPIEVPDARNPQFAASIEVWNELCRREPVYCVRLSWDDDENDTLVDRHLFHAFADGIRHAEHIDYARLLLDAGGQDAERFRGRLAELQLIGRPSMRIRLTRTTMYEKFVLAEGTKVTDGKYDPDKPYIVAVKWFLDLLYNANLADAIGRGLVTPVDSLHRSLLQLSSAPRSAAIGLQAVVESIQNALFMTRLGTEALRSFEGLTLSDVLLIRASDVWHDYANSVDDLLRAPWLISHPERGLPAIYRKYGRLIRSISGHRTS